MRFLCVHMTEGFFYMTGVKARVRSLGTLGMGDVFAFLLPGMAGH